MDGDAKNRTFDELCEIVGPIAAEYGIKRVYLFGSRARGDNDSNSDYDFCVQVPKGMGLFRMGGFFGKLEDALGTDRVDVVSQKAISDEFYNEISKDLRLVYEERLG